MAVIQDLRLATTAILWLENIRRDERANAQAYKDAVTAGKPNAAIISVALADATAYLALLARLQTAYQNNTLSFQSGFTALGIDPQEMVNSYQELKAAAQQQKTAAQTAQTSVDINNLANAVLASVALHADLN